MGKKKDREGARLAKLVDALTEDPRIASGDARASVAVGADDAIAIAIAMTDEIDEGTRARAALAAKRGTPLACAPGCDACCEEPVMVYFPEAIRAARWLARPESSSARERFLARYPAWREAAGDGIEELADISAERARSDRYSAAHRRQWQKRVLCAFDENGRCSIYAARPLACRNAHALGTSERCVAGTPIPAERLVLGPIDDFLVNAGTLLRAAHNAAQPSFGAKTNRMEALCAFVARLLSPTPSAPPSRT